MSWKRLTGNAAVLAGLAIFVFIGIAVYSGDLANVEGTLRHLRNLALVVGCALVSLGRMLRRDGG